MGKQSSLGPIDPQFKGISAFDVISEFEIAEHEILSAINEDERAKKLKYWALRLKDYPPTFYTMCKNAVQLSSELALSFLEDNMFSSNINKKDICAKIVDKLNERIESKDHSRHYNFEKCKSFGLDIELIEDDQKLQDALLSIHHASTITIMQTSTIKIIENHLGKAYLKFGAVI